jgi:CBS domain-containing protein
MPGGSVPVTVGTDLVGVLGERQVRRVRRDRWAQTHAGDVMTVTAGLPEIDPEMDLRSAFDQMLRSGVDGLPVFESGALVGLVTRRAVAEVIRDHMIARGGRPGSATGTAA